MFFVRERGFANFMIIVKEQITIFRNSYTNTSDNTAFGEKAEREKKTIKKKSKQRNKNHLSNKGEHICVF